MLGVIHKMMIYLIIKKGKTYIVIICLAFNELIGKKYLQIIDTNIITIGSFKSNFNI